MNTEKFLMAEHAACFDFFWDCATSDTARCGYGLVLDKTEKGSENVASIAGVGFALTALPIGIERGYITKTAGEQRAVGTLKTFLHHADHEHGFFYHFLDMRTAKRYFAYYDCASIIDTSLFLNGAITAAEYFGGECAELFEQIFERVNWALYYNEVDNVYFMGYDPARGGGFGAWDMYAEQLMQYILGVAHPKYPVPAKIYNGFRRDLGEYGGHSFYNSPAGSLFTHQFSHAWYDFKNTVDKDGINWFENSVSASKAARQYSIDNPKGFIGFHKDAWGLSDCHGPHGYRGYGTPPFHPNLRDINDGTVPPRGALGSLIFTPNEVMAAFEYYCKVPNLQGRHGLKNSYNQDLAWVCDFDIAIDKGITLLMIENYFTGLPQELYMRNSYVKKAAKLLGWT
ncbi:MAG: hypothetical protein FWG68_10565 [Defluviitaleaceae bacterium]|nr:hypothetical protein [Defluviitaleaceae bacterium]